MQKAVFTGGKCSEVKPQIFKLFKAEKLPEFVLIPVRSDTASFKKFCRIDVEHSLYWIKV